MIDCTYGLVIENHWVFYFAYVPCFDSSSLPGGLCGVQFRPKTLAQS